MEDLGMMPETIHFQFLLATFAGWVNRQQTQAIDYLREENRVLKEQLRGKRLHLTDVQRRRLAAKGKPSVASCSLRFPQSSLPTQAAAGTCRCLFGPVSTAI